MKSENASYIRINNELHKKIEMSKSKEINTDLQHHKQICQSIIDSLQVSILELREVISSSKELHSKQKDQYENQYKKHFDT